MASSKSHKFSSDMNQLARLAKALAHPARLAILQEIARRKTCVCGEIVRVLPLAQSTVSQHLKELKTAGLIIGEIKGPQSCYCLNPKVTKECEKIFTAFLKQIKVKSDFKKCC